MVYNTGPVMAGPGQSQEPGTTSGSSMWVVGAQVRGASAAFLGT